MAKKASRRRTRTARAPETTRRVLNLIPSKGTENDWTFRDALISGSVRAAKAPPSSVDLRTAWWAINDQEDTGSCVGWATADGVVRYHMVAAGRLGRNDLLSPRFVWMASKETDEFTARAQTFIEGAGTSLKNAMDVVRKYGSVLMNALPFHIATKMHTGDENAFYALAAQRKISAYFNLRRDLDQWKSWLASRGPILAGLNVDRTWDNAAATGGNLDAYVPTTAHGGHAVTIVGYTAAGRFIVRNSWGRGWGDRGFAYVTPQYIAAGFFDESYGVTL